MAKKAMSLWFWCGFAAAAIGGLLVLGAIWGMSGGDEWAYGAIGLFGGTLSMLVGIIGKGVELGVRAANDE